MTDAIPPEDGRNLLRRFGGRLRRWLALEPRPSTPEEAGDPEFDSGLRREIDDALDRRLARKSDGRDG